MSPHEQTTWPNLLSDLIAGHDLGREASEWAMAQIMAGEATPSQVAALIACVYRASEWGHKSVELAAHDLLQLLDETSS